LPWPAALRLCQLVDRLLGSIILGKRINYGIILISRYQELLAEGCLPRSAWRSPGGVMRGTGVARVRVGRYATLTLTSFRASSSSV